MLTYLGTMLGALAVGRRGGSLGAGVKRNRRGYWVEGLEGRILLTRLAVVGDFSSDLQTAPTRDVANLIKGWNPDGVVTTGDNNYPHGAASSIDPNIGQWYHSFIWPYSGAYGAGSADGQNHFWPTPGNHDWDPGTLTPYTNYFTLPNNERYYTKQIGDIAIFVCDGEVQEPDGLTPTSVQGNWIHNAMTASTATWKLVFYHQPVYSSGPATNPVMDWPFKTWGATAVFTGHDHQYERLSENGLTYFVDGLGGESIFDFNATVAGSQVRYNADYGAMRVDSTASAITFSFITRTGSVIDTYTIGTPVPSPPTSLQAAASSGQIALSWGAAAAATSYKVYRGTSPGGEGATPYASGVTGTSFTDTNVTTGVTYYYTVTGVNSAGEGARSVEASASLAPPGAPGAVQAVGGIGQIALAWGAASGASAYNVYRGTSPGAEGATPYATGVTGTSYTDAGLSNGATFYYKVTATNGLGEGPATAEAFATVVVPPAHVVVVIESHYNTTNIINEGGNTAPYINSLVDQGAYFSLAQGVTYPGHPNYLALFSGSTQGVTTDTVPSTQFTTANLGSELIAAGRTFVGYAEGLPSAGSLVNSSGNYIRYHNPWSEFSNVPGADNQPFTAFPTNFDNLPTVSFVVPDVTHDMHGEGTIAQADTWLQTNLGAYATWAQTHNSLLVVTWDDNDSGSDPANPIATIITGQEVQTGTFPDPISHYNVLRTIEDLYGLPRLGAAATSAPVQDAWHALPQGPPAPASPAATAGGPDRVTLTWSASAGATGYNVYRGTMPGGESTTPVASFVAGSPYLDTGLTPGFTYYYQVTAVNGSGESARSVETSAATPKATPVYSGLTSAVITYGSATTTLSGTILAGTLVPPGSVAVTVNGVTVNAAINASTGAFSTNFDTHAVPASGTAYTIGFAYAGNGSYAAASDTSHTLTVNPRALHVGAAGVSRVYDGTTAATVTLNDDRVNADVLTVTYGAAAFADKNVGALKPISVSGISVSGAAAGNYSLASTTTTTAADVTKRTLTVGATGVNKVYDGTTSAGATLSDNRAAGDALTVTYASATFATRGVGTGKAVSVSGIGVGGIDAGNYALASTTASATANVTARALTVTATGVNKVYDGTTAATVTLADNRVAGDALTVTYASAAFADKNVGAGKTVSVSGIAVGGTDAANYSPGSTIASATADVTVRSVGGSVTASDKVYDATTAATLLTRTVNGAIGGDAVTLGVGGASFDTKNVGAGKTVTATGLTLAGADATNYVLTNTTAATTASVTQRPITAAVTAAAKAYDGTTAATLLTRTPVGVLGTDAVGVTGGVATFDTKNVAAGKTVTATGLALGGADAGNYLLSPTSATTTADVTGVSVTGGVTAASKVYDGGTAATLATRTVSGVIGGDAVTLVVGGATFDTKDVGTGKTVTATGLSLAGADAGNYVLSNTTSTTTADVTARSVTPGVTAANKIYDGNAAATILTRTLGGAVGGDAVSLSGGTAAFDTKNVAAGKTVTATGLTLAGADAGNYLLSSTTATTLADVTAKSVTGSVTASDKVYDGTDAAAIAARSVTGALGGDAVTLTGGVAHFDTKDVGNGKAVTATGLALGGADAGNYALASSTATTTAGITPLSVSGSVTASDKVYDGGVAAAILTRTLGGVLGADAVTLSGGTATFDTRDVGVGKTVTVVGLGLSGADAGDYVLAVTTATTTANVTPLSVSGSVTASGKVYDGTTAAAIATRALAGAVGGDAVALVGGVANFNTKDAGVGKTVTATGLSLAGGDAGNYALASTTATTMADVTPRAVTPGVTASGKPYDGTTDAAIVTRTLTGVLGADAVTLVGGSASFDDKNVGAGKLVTVTGLALSGANAGDYVLSSTTATTTADVTAERVIAGTAGDDAITLVLDASGQYVDWFLGGATPALGQLLAADAAGLTIQGNGGNDAVTLDYSRGNPLPANLHLAGGTFTIGGLAGANPLAGTTLEIGRCTVYFTYADAGSDPLSAIKAAIGVGYSGGTWAGTGGAITSAAARDNPLHNTAIGYADFGDGTGVNTVAGTVMLKYAVVGDADLDGTVGLSDYTTVVRNFGVGTSWDQGAVTYGATVSLSDYTAVVRNFGVSVTGLAAPALAAVAPAASGSAGGTQGTNVNFPTASPASTVVGTTDAQPHRDAHAPKRHVAPKTSGRKR